MKETAEQARQRIRNAIRNDYFNNIWLCIIRDGFFGYTRNKTIYIES